MPGAVSCCKEPCDGSPCHIECVVSTADREDCDCHCHGEYHGRGAASAGGDKVSLRERISRYKRRHLRALSDDELEDRFRNVDWSDAEDVVALTKEIDRRDRAEKAGHRRKASRQAKHDEWYLIANAEMEQAESSDYVRGEMFSKRGARLAEKRGVTEIDLWRMSRQRADVYASDELKEWWDRHDGGHSRTTPGDVRRQAKLNAQHERDRYDERSPYPGLVP